MPDAAASCAPRILSALAPPLPVPVGYVEQHDTLLPLLTPAEMLLYTAELKHPHTTPRARKQRLVAALLDRQGGRQGRAVVARNGAVGPAAVPPPAAVRRLGQRIPPSSLHMP